MSKTTPKKATAKKTGVKKEKKLPAYTVRDGYYRKAYTRADGTKVKATYVQPAIIPIISTKPGKTGKGQKLITVDPKVHLSTYGYHTTDKKDLRHKALVKAAKDISYSTVIKRLNAISILQKYTNSTLSNKLKADMKYLKENREKYNI